MTSAFALRAAALASAAPMLAAPAAAEITRSSDSGFVSRHEVMVEASPKEVWLELISPAGWWSSDHTWSGDAANLTLTPQAGGCFSETIPAVDKPERFTLQGSVEHMRVIQAYPEQALRMQEYRAKTAPILPGYEARGIVTRVDGMAAIDTVAGQIDAILKG